MTPVGPATAYRRAARQRSLAEFAEICAAQRQRIRTELNAAVSRVQAARRGSLAGPTETVMTRRGVTTEVSAPVDLHYVWDLR